MKVAFALYTFYLYSKSPCSLFPESLLLKLPDLYPGVTFGFQGESSGYFIITT